MSYLLISPVCSVSQPLSLRPVKVSRSFSGPCHVQAGPQGAVKRAGLGALDAEAKSAPPSRAQPRNLHTQARAGRAASGPRGSGRGSSGKAFGEAKIPLNPGRGG